MLTKNVKKMLNEELREVMEIVQEELDSREAAARLQERGAERNWNRGSAALRLDMLDLAGIPAFHSHYANGNWDALPLAYRQEIARAHDEALA